MQKEINKTINGHDVNGSFYFTTKEVEASILVDGEEQYFYYDDVEDVSHEILINELMKSAVYRHEKQ
jgi:hypothetical protein